MEIKINRTIKYLRLKEAGFTLIEVLVSLVILAIALTALIYSNIESIHNTAYLKDKTAAHWVAMYVMDEVNLGLIEPPQAPGAKTGKSEMLGEEWAWSVNVSSTPDIHTLEVHINVSKVVDAKQYMSVIGYLWNPSE